MRPPLPRKILRRSFPRRFPIKNEDAADHGVSVFVCVFRFAARAETTVLQIPPAVV